MMAELGLAVDPLTVAAHYGGLLDGYVMDDADCQVAAMLDFADRIAARTTARMSGGRS
jgi:hypothetical protein